MRLQRCLVSVDLEQEEQRRIVPILVHVEAQATSGLALEAGPRMAQEASLVGLDGVGLGAQVGGMQYGHGARLAYRHDAVGLGTVPFAIVPPVLREIGHERLPMLEIIAPEADRAIDDSVARLIALGYGQQGAS